MTAGQTWLYYAVQFAGVSLIAAVYVAGLVVTLRRWHLGMPPRLGALGFGILLLSFVAQHLVNLVLGFAGVNGADAATVMFRITVTNSGSVLAMTAGHVLIVLALRAALRDAERSSNALPPGFGDDASFGGADRR